jgi:serine protease Do
MNKKQFFIGILLAAFLGAGISLIAYIAFFDKKDELSFEQKQNFQFSSNLSADTSYIVPEGLNFISAADLVIPAVVHIKSSYENSNSGFRNPFEEFFDLNPRDRGRRGQGFGSGVLISADGYIATNNHVIDNADLMEVTLSNGKKYKAQLVGTDPTTDLALIQIEASNLPFVKFGNSDNLRVGEWVLAVGNPFAQGTPFDLTSTVTAGIVSAKGRSIGILRDSLRIESFIQTDAAVNPGNSGGALVNIKGQLIGINTAIASPTGSYSGYSFAVPVSLVRKVMDDLLEYGMVQRALLGVTIRDITADFAEERNIKEFSGVYIDQLSNQGAAEEAGLEHGDIIIAIDENPTRTVSELQEQIARHRPGDKVKVTYLRNGSDKTTYATLMSTHGNTGIVKPVTSLSLDGIVFENLNEEQKQMLSIENGVQAKKVLGGIWKEVGIRTEYIITSIDKIEVNDVNTLKRILDVKKGEVILLLGMYPNGEKAWYSIKW